MSVQVSFPNSSDRAVRVQFPKSNSLAGGGAIPKLHTLEKSFEPKHTSQPTSLLPKLPNDTSQPPTRAGSHAESKPVLKPPPPTPNPYCK